MPEQLRRVSSVHARGSITTDVVPCVVAEETARRRAKAEALMREAARVLGYHVDELDAARNSLPSSLREFELGGWVPSHVAVHLVRRIDGLAAMAALADELDRAPDILRELKKRLTDHADRGRAWQEKSPHTGGWTKKKQTGWRK